MFFAVTLKHTSRLAIRPRTARQRRPQADVAGGAGALIQKRRVRQHRTKDATSRLERLLPCASALSSLEWTQSVTCPEPHEGLQFRLPTPH